VDALQHPWFEAAGAGRLKQTDLSQALTSLKQFTGHTKIKSAMLGFFV
jgi:hypothetical protein